MAGSSGGGVLKAGDPPRGPRPNSYTLRKYRALGVDLANLVFEPPASRGSAIHTDSCRPSAPRAASSGRLGFEATVACQGQAEREDAVLVLVHHPLEQALSTVHH
jgi:hypothetical protein